MPDDPELENIDPAMEAWMFHSWLEDFNEEAEMLKGQGILIGAFTNPEMAKRMTGQDGQAVMSTDEEFEKTFKMISEQKPQNDDKPVRKKNKHIKI